MNDARADLAHFVLAVAIGFATPFAGTVGTPRFFGRGLVVGKTLYESPTLPAFGIVTLETGRCHRDVVVDETTFLRVKLDERYRVVQSRSVIRPDPWEIEGQ